MTINGTDETTLGCGDPEKAFGETLITCIKKAREILAEVFSDDDEDMERLTLILAIHLRTALLLMEGSVALIQALQERLTKAEARLDRLTRASRPGPAPVGIPVEDLGRWFDERGVEVPDEHLPLLRELFRDVPHIFVADDD